MGAMEEPSAGQPRHMPTVETRWTTDWGKVAGGGDPSGAEEPKRPGDTEGPGDQGSTMGTSSREEARVPEDW